MNFVHDRHSPFAMSRLRLFPLSCAHYITSPRWRALSPATQAARSLMAQEKQMPPSASLVCKRQILRLPLNLTPLLWAAWFPAFLGKLLCPGHQMVQFCRIYISFFVTILRQLREDMPEVVVWAQIVCWVDISALKFVRRSCSTVAYKAHLLPYVATYPLFRA